MKVVVVVESYLALASRTDMQVALQSSHHSYSTMIAAVLSVERIGLSYWWQTLAAVKEAGLAAVRSCCSSFVVAMVVDLQEGRMRSNQMVAVPVETCEFVEMDWCDASCGF